MKDYIGKVNVPFEIENTVIIQYYSGAPGEILLCETDRDGKVKKTMPMRQVFSGVYVCMKCCCLTAKKNIVTLRSRQRERERK